MVYIRFPSGTSVSQGSETVSPSGAGRWGSCGWCLTPSTPSNGTAPRGQALKDAGFGTVPKVFAEQGLYLGDFSYYCQVLPQATLGCGPY